MEIVKGSPKFMLFKNINAENAKNSQSSQNVFEFLELPLREFHINPYNPDRINANFSFVFFFYILILKNYLE